MRKNPYQIIDDNALQDQSLFEEPLRAGPAEAFRASLRSSLDDLAMRTSRAFKDFDSVDDYINPSQRLSKDEYKESPYYRDGFQFDKFASANNTVSKSDLAWYSHLIDSKKKQNKILSQLDDGFLTHASSFAGGLIGTLLDPGTLAASAVAPELIGTKIESLLASIGERRAARIGIRGLQGAAEAGAITAPAELANVPTQKDYGFDDSFAQAFSSIATNALFGVFLRGTQGTFERKVIPVNDYKQIMETSAQQMEQGKSVYVDPIIKNGKYAQKLSNINDITKPVFTFDNEANKFKVLSTDYERLHKAPVEEELVDSKDIVFNEKKPILKFDNNIKKLRVKLDDYMNLVSNEIKKEPEEKVRLKVDASTNKIRVSLEKLEELRRLEKPKIEKMEAVYDEEISKIKTNIDDLKKLFKPRIKYANRITKPRDRSSSRIDTPEIMEDMEDNAMPLTSNEVKAAHEYINSHRSDSAHVQHKIDRYNEAIDNIPDNIEEAQADFEAAKKDFEKLKGDDEYDEVEQNIIQNMAKEEREKNLRAKSLNKAKECLVRNI